MPTEGTVFHCSMSYDCFVFLITLLGTRTNCKTAVYPMAAIAPTSSHNGSVTQREALRIQLSALVSLPPSFFLFICLYFLLIFYFLFT
jgi:hypothetical protein